MDNIKFNLTLKNLGPLKFNDPIRQLILRPFKKLGFNRLTASMDTDHISILSDETDINKAARCLKAMSHPLRLKILCVLGNESISVQDIVEQVGTSQSNISQHLSILREKNILSSKKEANRVYYFIDDTRVIQLIAMMKEIFCPQHH